MSNIFSSFLRSISFALWSLRRRTGQVVPVTIALLLLIFAVQLIGALHNVSSTLTSQQIARSWGGPYDLLIRPQSAVSGPERNAGWIAPQSLLENYGGISYQQVTAIRNLPHITQITPVATTGWEIVNILVPIQLSSSGIYRISATWNIPGKRDTAIVSYVEVTNLAQLTREVSPNTPIVQHVLLKAERTPTIYTMPVQALQAVIGIPVWQQNALPQVLLENAASTPTAHLSISVAQLHANLSMLPACMNNTSCWQQKHVQIGTTTYQFAGLQLLRYSPTHYTSTSQQLANGEVSILPLGTDMQGPIYRTQLPSALSVPTTKTNLSFPSPKLAGSPLPYSDVERLPLLTNAVHFIPLELACTINGPNCYSGLYIRLTGVEQYSQRSLSILQAIAAAIVARTGLHVDILDGSSLRTVFIAPSDNSQTPIALPVQTTWRVVGVAVQIVNGVDALQQILLILCTVVCILAIGAAGVLVGVARRKEALLLRQLGWQTSLLISVFALDGLLLCLPGIILIVAWTILAMQLLVSEIPELVTWGLLGVSGMIYCCSLVIASCFIKSNGWRKMMDKSNAGMQQGGGQPRPYHTRNTRTHRGMVGAGLAPALARPTRAHLALHRLPRTRPAPIIAPILASCLALTSIIFLIAIDYLLITSFDQTLIITVLGRQVRETLEGPQLLLLLIITTAALLTVSFCTKLLLQGRREELSLLARVGWERHDVLWHIVRENWIMSLGSGALGTLLALGLSSLLSANPSPLQIVVLLFCNPVFAVVLASTATVSIAWQETGRAYRWR